MNYQHYRLIHPMSLCITKLYPLSGPEGVWLLQTINSVEVMKEKAGNNMPYLKFYLKDNLLSGNTGCNEVSGKVFVTGDEIRFSEMSMSMIFCPDAKYEKELVKVLFYKNPLKYKIDSGNLTLFKEGIETMIFKRKDEVIK